MVLGVVDSTVFDLGVRAFSNNFLCDFFSGSSFILDSFSFTSTSFSFTRLESNGNLRNGVFRFDCFLLELNIYSIRKYFVNLSKIGVFPKNNIVSLFT